MRKGKYERGVKEIPRKGKYERGVKEIPREGKYERGVKEILVLYTSIGMWIPLSFTMMVFNKFILDKELYNWPFPISLTMIHMAFCSFIAFAIVRIFKLVQLVSMQRDDYISCVLPVGAFYAFSLYLSNSASVYLSLSFIQIPLALIPLALFSIALFKSNTLNINMFSISFALALALALAANHFYVSGLFIVPLAVVAFQAVCLGMVIIFLIFRGMVLPPMTSLYYVPACCFLLLFVPWLFLEFPILKHSSTFHFDFFLFGTNSFCALTFNFAMFSFLWKMSPLSAFFGG